MAEQALIIVATVGTFFLARYGFDIEDSGPVAALYADHLLDELLAAGFVLLLGVIWTATRRLHHVRREAVHVLATGVAFANVLDTIPNAVLLADAQGRVMANRAAARFLRIPSGKVVPMPRDELMAAAQVRNGLGQNLRADQGTLHQVLGGQRTEMDQIWRDPATGADVRMHCAAVPLEFQGRRFGALMLAQDVTQAWTAGERLKAADAGHLRMVRMVAHDLANAIAPMNLQMAVLARKTDAATVSTTVAVVQRCVANVHRLTGDLSDMAKLETGALPLHKVAIDLSASLAVAIDAHREQATAKGLRLYLQKPVRPLQAMADKDRIAQILDNLLSNALKFTPSGGQVVARLASSEGQARIEVADSGLGLTEEQRARLFQPFIRVHDPALAVSGTGLGLFITKGLVEAHGGRIDVASGGPGQGCTFTVLLPLPA